MEFLRSDQMQAINIGYAGEFSNSGPLLVELKAIPGSIGDDQRLLFNMTPLPIHGAQVQYVQKYTIAETQTQPTEPDTSLYLEHFNKLPESRKPFQCNVCGKRYVTQKSLKKHQVVHPEVVFDWQCRICNKTFPYKITMSRHLKLHAGEKLFKCENCSKRFETRYALVQHVKLHKNNVPFRCELCNKPFLKGAEFARHMRTHTGEKPYQCSTCGKSFTTKGSYLKHSEKKHNFVMA